MEDTLAQARDAIIAFGYTPETDGSLIKYKADRPRERWATGADGFLRFTRDDGQWKPVPYTIKEQWAKVSGLTAEEHPDCFEYVYPAEYVRHIYATAVAEGPGRPA
jgi:hypothetical protein